MVYNIATETGGGGVVAVSPFIPSSYVKYSNKQKRLDNIAEVIFLILFS